MRDAHYELLYSVKENVSVLIVAQSPYYMLLHNILTCWQPTFYYKTAVVLIPCHTDEGSHWLSSIYKQFSMCDRFYEQH